MNDISIWGLEKTLKHEKHALSVDEVVTSEDLEYLK
jgi:hypothetical protein